MTSIRQALAGLRSQPSSLEAGNARYEAGAYVDAVRIWRRAASAGSAEAAFQVAQAYAKREGVALSYPDAAAWYRRAAGAGHAETQFRLGLMLPDGVPALRGPGTPGAWCQQATEDSGQPPEVAHLLFPSGLAIERDAEQGVRWIETAAVSGHAEAQACMGDLRRHGRGCDRDLAAARG